MNKIQFLAAIAVAVSALALPSMASATDNIDESIFEIQKNQPSKRMFGMYDYYRRLQTENNNGSPLPEQKPVSNKKLVDPVNSGLSIRLNTNKSSMAKCKSTASCWKRFSRRLKAKAFLDMLQR